LSTQRYDGFCGTDIDMAISMNNLLSSMEAYADMSPDLEIRQQVNVWMQARDRQPLSVAEWCDVFSGESIDIAKATQAPNTERVAKSVLGFVYEFFGNYSGLAFSQVRPNDSLNRDLHFPLVCWFDWTLNFCDDFLAHFDLDLSDCFDEADFLTIGEMVAFLVAQVVAITATPAAPQPALARPYLQLAQSERAIALAA